MTTHPREAPRLAEGAPSIACARMTATSRAVAEALLAQFLRGDAHYLASSAAYGDGGNDGLASALDLFLARPEIGFVWLAFATTAGATTAVGA